MKTHLLRIPPHKNAPPPKLVPMSPNDEAEPQPSILIHDDSSPVSPNIPTLLVTDQVMATDTDLPSTSSTPPTSEQNVTPAHLSSPGSTAGVQVGVNSLPRLKTLLHRESDFRNSSTTELRDLKNDMMCNWLHQQQLERMWSTNGIEEGVMLKKAKDDYKCAPEDLRSRPDGLFGAVQKLNVKCAMTVNTAIIKLFLHDNSLKYVPLESGLRLQILPSISYLPECQKHHFAAFIQDYKILVVWDDDPNHLLQRVQNIEEQLISMVWKEQADDDESAPPYTSAMPSTVNLNSGEGEQDVENTTVLPHRRIVLIQPILTAITLILLISAISTGWRAMAIEIKVDKNWLRLAFLLVVPLQCWLGLFFMQSTASCVAQILGPISQMSANTKFFSGQAPPRLPLTASFPHVTIQCPVYKEGLKSVIDPTIKSIKAAISTYEMQGGTANIFINDDGMQLIPPEQAQERREYYDEHNIGWVARPRHDSKPANDERAFLRAGKFKKASNMNYALNVSARVEDKLFQVVRHDSWTAENEREAYDNALAEVIREDDGRTQAEGNVRIGDYILLIDSDTRVPVDCFLDAVSEMEHSPEVAIIQFASGVMNVTDSWFEQGITFFTNFVYTAIQYAVSNGDVAPFVGHNAFLRWSAVQDVAFTETDVNDGTTKEKYWSEATVSEDFDMALRLQTSGYILRLASYTGQGFKEGVSLTVYDELARWEKYAYGCSELIFHPFAQWFTKGPFTRLFRNFIASNMPLPSKITIMAYVGTYYALGSAWLLTLLNYFLIGWFNGHLDHYYVDSFTIYFALIVIFTGMGNLSLAVMRYRIEEKTLASACLESLRWIPLLTIFLGGISLHVSQAILSHLFSVDMSWGATSKEATDTSFFKEVPVVLRRFRLTFAFCTALSLALIVLSGFGPVGKLVPYDWQITLFTAIWPLAVVIGKTLLHHDSPAPF
ncbi:glycosyl transferase family group 2-domain-containing protein [Exophiala viscosa]|uniref:Glycosyl transferase family group 2-domain-containing protein n=1 Tax=Exophiala viscosa TaxID=2486360 RepID=A0AAN6DQ75_9EURO|nr:glycosyl transferase family group 2-domain-containing protein [Exophiala viscosa]